MRILSVCILLVAVSAELPKPKALLQRGKNLKAKIPTKDIQNRVDTTTKKIKASIPPLPTNVDNGATISNEVFNLVKAIVGVGVLSLPAGIAAFGSAPSALVPALGLITIIGLLSAYGFALIGKVCAYTGAKSYREAWELSVGPSTAWIPAWSATLKTLMACLAYSMVLADTFTSLLPVAADARNKVLLGVTTFVLLPLCWMKDLKSLAPFSLLGVMGMAYTALAMTVRFLDGSYSEGGALLEGVEEILQPSFGTAGFVSVFSPKSLILVCMLSTAYMVSSMYRFSMVLKSHCTSPECPLINPIFNFF